MYPGDVIIEIADYLEQNIDDDSTASELRELIYDAIDKLRDAGEDLQIYAHWDKNQVD